jgi:hypothetical protein
MFRIVPVLGLVALATPCLADDPAALLSQAFGNTIVSTYPDGRTAKLWLQPDGSYFGEGRDHDRSRGHWQVQDDKLCFKQAHPFAFGYVYCTRLAQFSSGSSWTGRAVTGETIQIKLVRGRSDSAEG